MASLNIVVVESPAKAKVIEKYLGNQYKVFSSNGHIRELPSKNGSVNTEDFSMTWQLTARGSVFVKDMKKNLSNADTLLLATDPDREGEGIAWHIFDALKKDIPEKCQVKRIAFNAITKDQILAAVKAPRDIDGDLVEAYRARLAIDYLVGFNLSPVLWRKLPGSKSAGRVQSVALRLLVEREEEINGFIPQEYWTIEGIFLVIDIVGLSCELICKLIEFDGKKIEKFDIQNEKIANDIMKKIENDQYKIASIEDTETKRNPNPPFSTSTLQQAGFNELGMRSVYLMRLAQDLYEGIDIGGGETVGLITYMRTDSVVMEPSAVNACRSAIEEFFGKKYVSDVVRTYKSKAKNAQESHEAIRPTNFTLNPSELKKILSNAHWTVYDLIWRRAVASQMASAIWASRCVKISGQNASFSTNGSKLLFDGFLKIMRDEISDNILPDLALNTAAEKKDITPSQHFTRPPARYTEASLVKKLEELGIGRPSTYARIFQILTSRDYANYDGRSIVPEIRGMLVVHFLVEFFAKYVEYDFTAKLEDQLDDISGGELTANSVLSGFWSGFHENIEKSSDIKINDVLDALQKRLEAFLFSKELADGTDPHKCPKCANGTLALRLGRFGAFIGCSNYIDKTCNYIKSIDQEGENSIIGQVDGYEASICIGPYGKYLKFALIEESSDGAKAKPIHIALTGIQQDISLDEAIFLKNLPLKIGIMGDDPITLCIGRFGPYVKAGSTMASLKKGDDIFNFSVERAIELIEERKNAGDKPKKRFPAKSKSVKSPSTTIKAPVRKKAKEIK